LNQFIKPKGASSVGKVDTPTSATDSVKAKCLEVGVLQESTGRPDWLTLAVKAAKVIVRMVRPARNWRANGEKEKFKAFKQKND
jgi:hypothetical protein